MKLTLPILLSLLLFIALSGFVSAPSSPTLKKFEFTYVGTMPALGDIDPIAGHPVVVIDYQGGAPDDFTYQDSYSGVDGFVTEASVESGDGRDFYFGSRSDDGSTVFLSAYAAPLVEGTPFTTGWQIVANEGELRGFGVAHAPGAAAVPASPDDWIEITIKGSYWD